MDFSLFLIYFPTAKTKASDVLESNPKAARMDVAVAEGEMDGYECSHFSVDLDEDEQMKIEEDLKKFLHGLVDNPTADVEPIYQRTRPYHRFKAAKTSTHEQLNQFGCWLQNVIIFLSTSYFFDESTSSICLVYF